MGKINTTKFWPLLFDEIDWTCLACTPTDTITSPVSATDQLHQDEIYFTINALDERSKRADSNVISHRTFLFEFDNMPMDKQKDLLANFPVPLTAAVFSGNKSIHFFVSLEFPVCAEEYAFIWRRIAQILPEGVDKSTKNPSRLARVPGAFRRDTRRVQELLYLGNRVSNSLLLSLLPELPATYPSNDGEQKEAGTTVFQRIALLEARENPDEVMRQMGLAGRNALFFWLGNRLRDDKKSRSEQESYIKSVYSALKDKKDFTWSEAKAAARL